MALSKQYLPAQKEPELMAHWLVKGHYHFDPHSTKPVYSIDTPPPTVSGKLHLGHVYSYSHADFMARYFRMRGFNVLYPMGFDDNGLPTERLVEKTFNLRAAQVGRKAFTEKCMEFALQAEQEYRDLWQRMGLSIDWRYTYRTIDDRSRRLSQASFLDLLGKGRVYRSQTPSIWCPECHTGIAQAEQNDLERESEFVFLPFYGQDGSVLKIATTRPELLVACVAVFVHPQDGRYTGQFGKQVKVPLYGHWVPVLPDPAADPQKGTGAVMCCTFGDQADVTWWQQHKLPLVEAIDSEGCMTETAGVIAGLAIDDARRKIKEILADQGLILDRQPIRQSIRVHERCDTPIEYIQTKQWFIRVIDQKEELLNLGRKLRWHPQQMHARYQDWVENLNWDWCISRQRTFGVPFPVWFCQSCGETMAADLDQLPLDPAVQQPTRSCVCGSRQFIPETDVMDTWATSSITPQIVSGWLDHPDLFNQVFPLTLRPQAHDIIRTWAFYSIVKSYAHFGILPWSDVFISGWGIAGEGMGKISKSRGGGPMPPAEMINRYSADAMRYWAASTSPGKDAVISEEKIQMGAKLVTKLWNVARFAEPFISVITGVQDHLTFTPADRWITARCRSLVSEVTGHFEAYDYASAKNAVEIFFWHDLADNYLEMAKQRLYDPEHTGHLGARTALRQVIYTLLQLLAPLLPFVTDAIYQSFFAVSEGESIHKTQWPTPDQFMLTPQEQAEDEHFGEVLVTIATAVRRYKSEHSISLGSEISELHLVTSNSDLGHRLLLASPDLASVTRARKITTDLAMSQDMAILSSDVKDLTIGLKP